MSAAGLAGIPDCPLFTTVEGQRRDQTSMAEQGPRSENNRASLPNPVENVSIALSNANRRVTFMPASSLAFNAVHEVTLTTDITDLAGLPLDNPSTLTFVTSEVPDLTRPFITALNPLSGATGWLRTRR